MPEGPQHRQITRRVGVAVGSGKIPPLTAGLVLEPGGPAFTDERRAGEKARAAAVRTDLEVSGDDLVEQGCDRPHQRSNGTGDEDRAMPGRTMRADRPDSRG